jgi:hypothetical protein
MTFEEILPHIKKGEKVRRKEWEDGYMVLSNRGARYLYLYCNGTLFDDAYNLSGFDITSDDWEVL